MLILGPHRFALVPWGWISQADLREGGPPELTLDIRKLGRTEKHMLLLVRGEFVPQLGMVAIRCERHSGWDLPLTMAIVDTAAVDIDTDDGA